MKLDDFALFQQMSILRNRTVRRPRERRPRLRADSRFGRPA